MIHQLARLIFLKPILMKQIVQMVLLVLGFCSLQGAAVVPVAALPVVTTSEQPKQSQSPYTLQTALTEPIAQEVEKATFLPRELSRIIGSYIPSLPLELLPLCLGQHKSIPEPLLHHSGPYAVSKGFYVCRYHKYCRRSLDPDKEPFLDIMYQDLSGCNTVVASVSGEQVEDLIGPPVRECRIYLQLFCRFGPQIGGGAVTVYAAFNSIEEDSLCLIRLLAFDFDPSEQSQSNRLKHSRILLQFSYPFNSDYFGAEPHLAVSTGRRALSLRLVSRLFGENNVLLAHDYHLPHDTVIPYPVGGGDDEERLTLELKNYLEQDASFPFSKIRLHDLQISDEAGLALALFSVMEKLPNGYYHTVGSHVVLFDRMSGKVILTGRSLQPFESNPNDAEYSLRNGVLMHPSGLLYVGGYKTKSCGIASDVVKAIMERPEQVAILKRILQRYHATYDQGWAPTLEETAEMGKLDPLVKQALDAYVSNCPERSSKIPYRKIYAVVGNLVRVQGESTEGASRQLIVPLEHDTDTEPKQLFVKVAKTDDQAAHHRKARRKKFAAVAISCVAAAGGYKLFKKWRAKCKLPVLRTLVKQ